VAIVDRARLGRIHVRRSNLHRIDRWRDGADLIYVGPNGLAGWQEPEGAKVWLDDLGRPTTVREGALIYRDWGHLLVFSLGGNKLAELKVRDPKSTVLPGLFLENLRCDVRLDWLRISRWNCEIPGAVRADQTRIQWADGLFIDGQLSGWDAASREFVIKTEKGESRVCENRVSSVFLPITKDDAPRMLRAVYHDGSWLSGEPSKEDGMLALAAPSPGSAIDFMTKMTTDRSSRFRATLSATTAISNLRSTSTTRKTR